jgi:hypothetical protein
MSLVAVELRFEKESTKCLTKINKLNAPVTEEGGNGSRSGFYF